MGKGRGRKKKQECLRIWRKEDKLKWLEALNCRGKHCSILQVQGHKSSSWLPDRTTNIELALLRLIPIGHLESSMLFPSSCESILYTPLYSELPTSKAETSPSHLWLFNWLSVVCYTGSLVPWITSYKVGKWEQRSLPCRQVLIQTLHFMHFY